MVPSLHSSDDVVWISGPGEGFRVIVCFGDEAIDGSLEIDEGVEDAALEPSPGEFGEEAFDSVEPGAVDRYEMEGEAPVAAEPGAHLGMLVGGVVVEDHMDALADWDLGLDGVEEADEHLVAVALHVQRPMTLPSSVSRAANGMLVPWRL